MLVLIKSPFNYIGNKYKILDEIIPLMPKDIDTFYDIFGGGFSVGINAKANKLVYNDIVPQVLEVLKELYNGNIEEIISSMDKIVSQYNLSKENLDGFLQLRKDYNENPNWLLFYVMIQFSFNNQYRFNNKKEYNSSFGKHKSIYNDITLNKLRAYNESLKGKDVLFLNNSLYDFDFSIITTDDFVFLDPPYIISKGNYNDGKRGFEGWSVEHEEYLYEKVLELHKRGVRFGLTNLLEHKGLSNEFLQKLIDENNFTVHVLSNKLVKSYNSKNDSVSKEIYLTNI